MKAHCPKCGYTLTLPPGASPGQYLCPECGLPLVKGQKEEPKATREVRAATRSRSGKA